MRGRLLTISFLFLLALGMLFIPIGTECVYALTEREIILELEEGESSSTANLNMINAACDQASEDEMLVIRISSPGIYYVGAKNGGRSIHLKSNVTLDLNGATLIRAGKMYNFIQNCGLNDMRTAGVYSLSHNMKVMNGTLDGSGGSGEEVNLVNLGHAEEIEFSNLTLQNCRGGHLIELSGCKDVTIVNCIFDGHQGSKKEGEAVQLDISYNGANSSWNGVYTSDGTVCQNITVTDCIFKDYPSGVGNHHTIAGEHHSQNITIKNNLFMNTEEASAPAIWCYGFDGCVVENNIISGNYTYGILVSGGSDITVKNNQIGTRDYPIYGQGIDFTAANSYIMNQGSERKSESTENGVVSQNKVYVTGSGKYGILISSGCYLEKITENEVTSGMADGIRVTGQNSWVGSIGQRKDGTGNVVTAARGMGIALGDHAAADQIVGNTIVSKSGGIQIASGSTTGLIGDADYPNLIQNSAGNGIVVTGSASSVQRVSSNQIVAKKGAGVLAQLDAEIKTIDHNQVKSGNLRGVSVTLSANVTNITGNTLKGFQYQGIYIGNSASVKNITTNEISNGTGAGVYITSAQVTGSIQKNTILNCKTKVGNGISVSSTGVVKSIKGNTIEKNKGYGISITNKKLNVVMKNNTFQANKCGKVYIAKK